MQKSDGMYSNMRINKKPTKESKMVEKLLNVISYLNFTNIEYVKCIQCETALIGLQSSQLEDIISILSEFPNFKGLKAEAISLDSLNTILSYCNDSIEHLKAYPKYGETYYKIIQTKYIEKKLLTMDKYLDLVNLGSSSSFYDKKNEALNLLYDIWFGFGFNYTKIVLEEIIDLS